MQFCMVLGELTKMISEHTVVADSKTFLLGGETLCGALSTLEARK